MKPIPASFHSLTRKLLAAVALAVFGAVCVQAENVFVMSYQNNTATTGVTPCVDSGPSCHTGTSFSLFGGADHSNPNPPPPVTSRRSVYHYSQDGSWSVRPGDYTLFDPANNYYTAALQYPAVYKIYVAKPILTTPDLIVNITVDVGDLADTNGVAATSIPTAAFNSSTPAQQWIFVAYLTNSTPNPIVTFTYASGTCNNSGNRWYTDVVRFERLDPCAGVADPPIINGPLAAGQSFVNVAGVTQGATNITVYANAVEIGQTNWAAGFAAGQVTVNTTSALVQSDSITARQTVTNASGGACVSDPSPAVPVGGGANPTVEVCLGLWQSTQFAGPVGASTTANLTNSYFLKASGLASGYNSAPTGGAVLSPGQCWQTVTFQNGIGGDDGILPGSAAHFTNYDAYCALEGLIFSISQTSPDSGPYDIYVDQIKNGDVVIEDFEGYTNGAVVTFTRPNQATTPPAANTYLTDPNSAAVSQLNAASGTNALRIRWQFQDAGLNRWAHLRANASVGKQNPQLDATKPITIRYLVLPVGESTNKLSVGPLPNQTKFVGQPVTFTALPKGEGPFTYQWKKDGADLIGYTTSTYSIGSVSPGDAGLYSVVVDNAACDPVESTPALLTVQVAGAPVTITGLTGTSLNYTGGLGSQFVLLQSGTLAVPRSNWTRVATNPATPGSFTIPAVGTPPSPTFYSIQSE
jgi:hypothetical protein